MGMELDFKVRELTATCGDSVLIVRQFEDGVVEVFLDGVPQGQIALTEG